VLEKFSSTKGRVVLLISLKAGGVGLNLVAASRVYMLDPWWSFAVEAQAIDRIHRVGQNKNVVIIRFIVKDSVEEKMLKIQDRKASFPPPWRVFVSCSLFCVWWLIWVELCCEFVGNE